MKKEYITPIFEIIKFESEDIITTSNGNPLNPDNLGPIA